MAIIFLDVDGVLIADQKSARANRPSEESIDAVNYITDKTGAGIVVSASMRARKNWLETMLGWGITGNIVGATPLLDGDKTNEIQSYLFDHPEEDNFIIIDDVDIVGHLASHQVKTYWEVGLTMVHAQQIAEVLILGV